MDYNHLKEVASAIISATIFFCVPIAQEHREEERKLNNKERQQNKN